MSEEKDNQDLAIKKTIEFYIEHNHFGKLLGKRIEVIKAGEIRYSLTVRKEHQALPNVAHGGLVAGLMDGVLGAAALTSVAAEDKFISTVEFKIHFFKPLKVGEKLIGTGRVISRGKRILISEGEIHSKGELVAKGIGTFNAYPASKVERA